MVSFNVLSLKYHSFPYTRRINSSSRDLVIACRGMICIWKCFCCLKQALLSKLQSIHHQLIFMNFVEGSFLWV